VSELLEYAELVAFVASTDLQRSRAFYEGVLGLRVQRTTSFALVLVGGGTTVRVTRVDLMDPAPYTVLGWVVQNVEETVRTLAARGVRFQSYDDLEQDEYGIWQSPDGARVAWLKDPDGNVLSLTQV
jgi:catechol 2,3-dioxygenase-like lactoylglutathione lyase family enzyme